MNLMKPITVILLAALVGLIAIRIYNQYRRNHVAFVTFDSEAAPSRDNPVDLGLPAESFAEAAEDGGDMGDIAEFAGSVTDDDVEDDAMVVLYDTHTNMAFVSYAVMQKMGEGNRAVCRKLIRFLEKHEPEKVILLHVGKKAVDLPG